MDSLWFKDALIYCVAVETYRDANGDGFGDFAGLTEGLDHLEELGATCVWLEPFYPSPLRDNGYDVADHRAVHPRLGTLDDFDRFIAEADRRGIRVLADLVINHTSDTHPWFQSARADPDTPYRDYYLWTDDPQAHPEPVAFPTVETSPWTYDEAAGRWYLHRFYSFEPDLNVANPRIAEELRSIMEFWLDRGVAGFRVDASQFLVQKLEEAKDPNPHRLLRDMRRIVSGRRADGVLLAEADVELDQLPAFFGDGDEMSLLLNFYLDANLFLALARGEANPVARLLDRLPPISPQGQWANFLRNQDELNLARLDGEQQREVFAAFAPREEERVFGRGIRRRLPTMLGGDRRRIELAYSVLFSLHGTPLMGYGDEIGMGDDLRLPERMSVRTPMQWSAGPNAGFSSAPADRLIRPVIATGPFGCERVNVERQRADEGSLLRWMQRVWRARRELPQIGRGRTEAMDTGDPAVLAHRCEWRGRGLLALHNFSDQARAVALPAGALPAGAVEVIADTTYDAAAGDELVLTAYGYRWLDYSTRP